MIGNSSKGEGLPDVSDPEPDEIFRERLLRVVAANDRHTALFARGSTLDRLGRKYDRFRTGVALQGLEKQRERS